MIDAILGLGLIVLAIGLLYTWIDLSIIFDRIDELEERKKDDPMAEYREKGTP